jgi:hypothetical protein
MSSSKHRVAHFARRWAQAVKHEGTPACDQILTTGNCVKDPVTQQYVVAPALDGRISRIDEQAAAAAAAAAGGEKD